jgi:hypothetical protein
METAASVPSNPHTVEEGFLDYRGRRTTIIRALTTEVDRFYSLCDPEDQPLVYSSQHEPSPPTTPVAAPSKNTLKKEAKLRQKEEERRLKEEEKKKAAAASASATQTQKHQNMEEDEEDMDPTMENATSLSDCVRVMQIEWNPNGEKEVTVLCRAEVDQQALNPSHRRRCLNLHSGKTSYEITTSFPLFIKTIVGSSLCLQVQDSDSVFELKTQIHQATWTPPGFQ